MATKNSSGPAALFDRRSDLFRAAFDRALSLEQFVAAGAPQHQQRWHGVQNSLALTSAQQELLGSFKRELNLLILAGVWCGDCARQCPMLWLFETVNPRIRARFIDNAENPDLQDELRICGGTRVPVVVGLTEDFFEIGRAGDRMLSVYRRKARNELGAACEIGGNVPADELATELGEWLEVIERWSLMARLSGFLRKRHGD